MIETNEVQEVIGTTYVIGSHKLADAAHKIELANRKLARAGIEERFSFTSEIVYKSETFEDGTQSTREMAQIVLSAPSIAFGGFTFIAKVESLEDDTLIVSTAPGQDLQGFVPTDMICEHCKKNRYRSATYIVRSEDGQLHQVGKSCLQLFTGVTVSGLWALEFDLTGGEDEESEGWGFYGAPSVYTPLDLFKVALVGSNMGLGFKPASSYNGSTINEVSELLFGKPQKQEERDALNAKRAEIQAPEVAELAAKILEFAQNLDANGNDYYTKVRALSTQEHIVFKFASTLISIIGSYNKALEREVEKRAEKLTWNNEVMGVKGDKLVAFTAIVKFQPKPIETNWGTSWIYKFQDAKGHVLTWFASNNQGLELGDLVTVLKATVKGSTEFQGFTSTDITRVTVEKI